MVRRFRHNASEPERPFDGQTPSNNRGRESGDGGIRLCPDNPVDLELAPDGPLQVFHGGLWSGEYPGVNDLLLQVAITEGVNPLHFHVASP